MRIGILGGTFNPPHVGHIGAAKTFLEALELDKLLIIPTATPPHKEYKSDVDGSARLEMCKVAFDFDERIEVSDIELKRGGKSYTYLTLEELYDPENELYFLVGTDMMLTLDRWVKPERIFELATIVYARRESDESLGEELTRKAAEYKNKFGAKIIAINNEVIEISSERIRASILNGDNSSGYLCDEVYSYIEKGGLYR